MEIASRTGIAAFRAGRAEIHTPSQSWDNQCQYFCRTRFNAPPGFKTAWLAWQGARLRHHTGPEDAPYGTVGYFKGPGPAGHAVMMGTRGHCLTNDAVTDGRISFTTVEFILDAWPGAEWVGWTEDINGRRIWGHGPSLSADAIRKSQRGDHVHEHGALLKQEIAAAVGKHGMNLHTNQVGEPMHIAVKALQKQIGFKQTGMVGPGVLAYLADRRSAFTARP